MRFSARKHLPLACVLLVLAACEDPSGGGPGPLARVVVVSGDLQTAVAGTELPELLVVRAEDARGRAVSGEVLNFVVTAGAGQIYAGAVQTDDEGIARNRWTLATAAGDTQRVEVRATDAATGQPRAFAQLRAVARAGAPASFTVLGGNNQTGLVGAPLPDSLAVIVRDAQGNPVPGVDVAWSTPNGGSLLPSPAATDAQGVARVRWTLPTVPGPLSATATLGSTSLPFAAHAVAGPTVAVTLTPFPIQGHINTNYMVEAMPRDPYGNPTEGPIDFIIGDPAIAYINGASTGLRFQVYLRALGETTLTARIRGTSTEVVVPLRVVPISFARVSAGGDQSCGVSTTGETYCWYYAPLPLGFPSPSADIQTGQVTCALSAGGVVRCALNAGNASFASIAVGYHICALDAAGAAWCWAPGNSSGWLGTGTNASSRTPVPVAGGRTYTALSVGLTHACAVSAGGAAYCWGDNGSGQLGAATGAQGSCLSPCSLSPVAVTGGVSFRSVTAGFGHTCGLDGDGAAWCWGANHAGQLGDGTAVQRNAPVRVADGLTFRWLSAGYEHTCGVTSAGAAWCWGSNSGGQLGTGTFGGSALLPTPVAGGIVFTQIDGGREHTCAVGVDQRAYCWGDNRAGQLGTDSPSSAATPQRVRG